jgi:hypothetical protein
VAIFNKPIGSAQNKPLSIATVPTSPGNFTFQVSAGTYYLAYYLAVMPDGTPDVGEPFQLYNHQLTPPGTAAIVIDIEQAEGRRKEESSFANASADSDARGRR